jgi:hypothetical protein
MVSSSQGPVAEGNSCAVGACVRGQDTVVGSGNAARDANFGKWGTGTAGGWCGRASASSRNIGFKKRRVQEKSGTVTTSVPRREKKQGLSRYVPYPVLHTKSRLENSRRVTRSRENCFFSKSLDIFSTGFEHARSRLD